MPAVMPAVVGGKSVDVVIVEAFGERAERTNRKEEQENKDPTQNTGHQSTILFPARIAMKVVLPFSTRAFWVNP